MGAVLPERLEEVPVLEERPAATGTREARHPASSPGDRAHPGEPDSEKRRLLQEEIVQHVDNQKHYGDVAEEQQPKNRGPAIQITPRRLEGGIGGRTRPAPAGRPSPRSVLWRPRLPSCSESA